MVRSVIQMLYREVRGLHQAAYVLGAFAFLSQLLALVRDRLLAHQFGAGFELDLYYAAFRIPDLLYVLFASTLSVYVLIPFVASRVRNDNATDARLLLSQIFSVFLVGYTILAAGIFVIIPYLVPLLFPGFIEHTDQFVLLVRILLLQPLLLGMSSLLGVVTQLGHRFVLYAISPLIYNIGIIIGIAFFYPVFGLAGLAYGVVLGAFGHVLVQVPLMRSSDLHFGITTRISYPLIGQVLKVSIPRALTLAMHQVVLLVLVSIASVMTVGSVAVFQFAYNLQSVPLAVIGASYSIAAFPLLADLFAQKKMSAFRLHILAALRHIIFWSVPIIGLIVVLRAQIVRVVLGSGSFDWADTRLTAAVLALLVISLFAQAINLLLIRAFYAGGYTRIPFMVTLFGSIFAIVLALIFRHLYLTEGVFAHTLADMLRVSAVQGTEIIVIALGYSIAMVIQTVILLVYAARTFAIVFSNFHQHLLRAICAMVVGSSAAYITLNFFVEGVNQVTFLGIFIQGALGGVAGLAGIILTYYALRSPELTEVYKAFHSRVFKTKVVASQEDVL